MAFVLLALLVTVFLSFIYFRKKQNYFKDLGIPHVPAWPVLGNMGLSFLRLESMKDTMAKAYSINHDALYVGHFDFMRPTIILRDPELIKDITIKNFSYFPDHPNVYIESDRLWNENFFSLKYPKWKEVRSVLSLNLTTNRIKGISDKITIYVLNCIEHLSNQSLEENHMINTLDMFGRFIIDIMALVSVGIDVDSYKDANNMFLETTRQNLNLEKKLGPILLLARGAPWLMDLLNIKLISDKAGDFYKHIVRSIIEFREKEGKFYPDFMQTMMKTSKNKPGWDKTFDLTGMTAQVILMMLAGTETTTSQTCCMAHELALNLDIQRRLQKEIDDVFRNTNHNPTYEEINEMPYLNAVVREVIRFHSVPSLLDRVCVKEFVLPPALPGLQPFVVKPGTSVLIPVHSIQRDEKYFDDPNKFNPDRYLMKKSKKNDGIHLSFGIGPRHCPGQKLAVKVIKLLFFNLLQKFNLRPNKKTSAPLEYDGKSISLSAKGGFWLDIEPRT